METRTDRTSEKNAAGPALNGCRVHPDCLECPLPICIMELTPPEARRAVYELKTDLMDRQVKVMMVQGLTRRQAVTQMAGLLGVKHTSNIYRKLKKHREKKLAGAVTLHQSQRE